MATIQVNKPFSFNHPTGHLQRFESGTHQVPDHVADHWYVREHSAKIEKPEAPAKPKPKGK